MAKEAKKFNTGPLNWKEVDHTNRPFASASNVDQEELGCTREEFKKIGVQYAFPGLPAARTTSHPHYIHNLDNLIRFGGLFPPVHVHADIRRTRLLWATQVPDQGGLDHRACLGQHLPDERSEGQEDRPHEESEHHQERLVADPGGTRHRSLMINAERHYPRRRPRSWSSPTRMTGMMIPKMLEPMDNPSELWLQAGPQARPCLPLSAGGGELGAGCRRCHQHPERAPCSISRRQRASSRRSRTCPSIRTGPCRCANVPAVIVDAYGRHGRAAPRARLSSTFMKGIIKVGRWANEHKHAAAAILDKQTFYLDVENTDPGKHQGHRQVSSHGSPQNLDPAIEIGKDFMPSHGYIKNGFDVHEAGRTGVP